MTLLREIRKATRPKKLVHYAVLLSIAWISYRLYAAIQGEDGRGRPGAYGPRDIGQGRDMDALGGEGEWGNAGQRVQNLDGRLKDLHGSKKGGPAAAAAADSRPKDAFGNINGAAGKAKPRDIDAWEEDGARGGAGSDNDGGGGGGGVKINRVAADGSLFDHEKKQQQQQQQQQRRDSRHETARKKRVKPEGPGRKSVDFGGNDGRFDRDDDYSDDAERGDERLRFEGERDGDKGRGLGKGGIKEKYERLMKEQAMAKDAVNFPAFRNKPAGPAQSIKKKVNRIVKENVKAKEEKFQIGPKPVDWDLEDELRKRRRKYYVEVDMLAEPYDPKAYENMQEDDNNLAFVTAFTPKTRWKAVLQFVHSVQYHYPKSPIGIFDLGLNDEQIAKLETFCRVTVHPTFTSLWPSHLGDISKGLWRPMIWQMGLSSYGHIVYMEPERFLMKKNLQDYIDHSLQRGIVVVGRKLQYSPFVVTNPEMYHFLNVDTRKLQRVKMLEITMLLMHNAEPVRHDLMRHLVACTLEEYCISPPGATHQCDGSFFPNSKKYANCHRYDQSAVNILLDKWFSFDQDRFLVRDVMTSTFDGRDVSSKLLTCSGQSPQERRQEI